MPLTWKSLDDCLPPLNLWSYPAWVVPSLKEKETEVLIELTEEEVKAFKNIYEDNACYEYLTYTEEDVLLKDAYATLFTKLGIDVTGEEDASS